MLIRLREDLDKICHLPDESMQVEKRRILHLMHAMEMCLKETCKMGQKESVMDMERLLKTNTIPTNDFCHLIDNYVSDLAVPFTARNVNKVINNFNLNENDLVFDTNEEDEMLQKMQTIWNSIQNKPKEIENFKQLLSILFSKTTQHVFDTNKPQQATIHISTNVIRPSQVYDIKEVYPRHFFLTFGALVLLHTVSELHQDNNMLYKLEHIKGTKLHVLNKSKTLEQATVDLQDMIHVFVQTPATQRLDVYFWDSFDETVDNYYYAALKDFKYPLNRKNDTNPEFIYGTCLIHILKYRHPIQHPASLKASFPNLSEDIINIECINEDLVPHALLLKWSKLKNGIISRVWDSQIETKQEEKFRDLLTFFPMPYSKMQGQVLNLLLTTNECKKVKPQKNQALNEDIRDCGCNCNCSTTLGIMIANDLGLLGNSIHVVITAGHIYLASGNRKKDWKIRDPKKLRQLETTNRNVPFACYRPLQPLSKIVKDDDVLIPNTRIIYILTLTNNSRFPYLTNVDRNKQISHIIQRALESKLATIFDFFYGLILLTEDDYSIFMDSKIWHEHFITLIKNQFIEKYDIRIDIFQYHLSSLALKFTSFYFFFLIFFSYSKTKEDFILMNKFLIGSWISENRITLDQMAMDAGFDPVTIFGRVK